MAEKVLKTRTKNKHDVEANWKLAKNFTPLDGELIIYDEDSEHAYKRLKIGDGEKNVNDLAFFNDNIEVRLSAIEKFLMSNDYDIVFVKKD